MFTRALALLQEMLGPQAQFRAGQAEAIEALVVKRQRLLIVQRTGWGKSIVYFLAAKLLREHRAGPALLVSPLLSLMRNQIAMAQRIGIRALTLHSDNRTEWETIESDLRAGNCDVLLISPERLANERFRTEILPAFSGRIGLFVVDEAHCISDWGHDFRPDYRRIVRIVKNLPPSVPVLATTATANDRVVQDIRQQLGDTLMIQRGPLARASLRLANIHLPDQPSRLAWLATYLAKLTGSGIIYCLTVADTLRVARWLKEHGIRAESYSADCDGDERVRLEQALVNNELKALVATVALGMGFDKPDLGFVIHYQKPGSVVAYYQQVGRAGRAVDKAYGLLLCGAEDDAIHDYFIDNAFPKPEIMEQVVKALTGHESLSIGELLGHVNISRGMAEKTLKLLEIDGAVGRSDSRWFRTANPWKPDRQRIENVTGQRRRELQLMNDYVRHRGCLMEFLACWLDDPQAARCGVCINCVGKTFPTSVEEKLVAAAVEFLQAEQLVIEPRKQWPAGIFPDEKRTIAPEHRNAPGRALSNYGDAGWGKRVQEGKYHRGRFDEVLVEAAAELIHKRWRPDPSPQWLTAIPSVRHPGLVRDFAERLAGRLGIPFHPVLACCQQKPEQKTMMNSNHQARNAKDQLVVQGAVPSGPVLLLDDIMDSGWTLTIAGRLLREKGSGVVHPFVLARASYRDS